jgi:primosomal protein N'
VQATQPKAWDTLTKNHGAQAGETLLARLRDQIDQRGTLDVLRHGIELLGPVPAPMERRAGRFRAQLLLQANARAQLHRLISAWLLVLEQLPGGRQVRWSLDVDPVDLY